MIKIKQEDFLNQKVSEMSIEELAEAIKMKVLRTELKEGVRVKITQYCEGGNNDGRGGIFLGIEKEGTFQGESRVRLDNGVETHAYKVEKIESETKTLSDKSRRLSYMNKNTEIEAPFFELEDVRESINKFIDICTESDEHKTGWYKEQAKQCFGERLVGDQKC